MCVIIKYVAGGPAGSLCSAVRIQKRPGFSSVNLNEAAGDCVQYRDVVLIQACGVITPIIDYPQGKK